MPERVLLVTDYGGSQGGAELLFREVRIGLRGRGIDARLLTSDCGTDPGVAPPDYLFKGSTGSLRALRETINPSLVRVARHVLSDFDPQVVQIGLMLTQVSPLLLPIIQDRASVFVVQDFRPICPKGTRVLPDGARCTFRPGRSCRREGCFGLKGWVPRMAQLALLQRWIGTVDRIVAPSRSMAQRLAEQGLRVDAVIPNGIRAPGPARTEQAEVPTVAFAGRLVPEKGVDTLLHAFALLLTSMPDARLMIVGDGPERGRLEALVQRLEIGEAVDFLGHRSWDETQELLAAAWVQSVPSLWDEPYGLVTSEAQMRGTPVVASRAGALPELIQHGETGLLVAPADPNELCEALGSVLSHEGIRRRLTDNARAWASQHAGLEGMIDGMLALYEEILTEPKT